VAGVQLCSQGDIRSGQGRVLVRRTSDYWAKVFLHSDRVIGSIQIGSTAGAAQLKQLMDLALPITGFEERLLEDGFDFSRIPGFPT
jgi:NAD(P)H-nitrite reductase large subunit